MGTRICLRGRTDRDRALALEITLQAQDSLSKLSGRTSLSVGDSKWTGKKCFTDYLPEPYFWKYTKSKHFKIKTRNPKIKNKNGAGEMAQMLTTLAAVAEDLDSNPTWQLRIIYNSSFRGAYTLFWPLPALHDISRTYIYTGITVVHIK